MTPEGKGPPPREAAVAFGANLEGPLESIRRAEALLGKAPGLRFKRRSGLWLTEPVGGPPGQGWYHNQVILYETDLGPEGLMELLLGAEADLGRVRKERWGPRLIDLDLLFLDDLILEGPLVTLPHPRLAERAFVLKPLSEAAPGWIHPVLQENASALLERLTRGGPRIRRLAEGP
jgi:2-amino-4-hydroxy-6-hydroxymethyldihydropteridine diphosphokinase